jgi:N4-gp56 family major capsid protein
MAIISRASLPQEFFDITSSMLLVQPEPQYLHAQLMKMALNAELSESLPGLGMPGRDGIGAAGEAYAALGDQQLVLDDPIMGECVKVVSELDKAPGHTVRINRPAFANTTYTQASREISNGASISTTPIDVTSEQVSITLRRFAGPYDSTNSRVAPFGVDRFDASMSLHKLAGVVGLHMKRDFDKWLDKVGVSLFDAASSTVRPNGFTADNDSTAAGDAPLDFDTISRVEKTLDEANVPVFGNGKRVMVLHPNQLHQLKNDPQFGRYAEHQPPVNPVLQKTYFKSVAGFDIYKSTTLSTASNSSSVTIYRGQAFGPGMAGAGVGMLPEVRFSSSDNYGEQALVIWLTYMGFTTLDNRFGVLISTS